MIYLAILPDGTGRSQAEAVASQDFRAGLPGSRRAGGGGGGGKP